MNIIVTPVAALLIGLFVRSRLVGVALYLGIEAVFFTFQTLVVLLAWMSGQGGFGGATETGAFGAAPTGFPLVFDEPSVWLYGTANFVIILIGVCLTVLISALAQRRRSAHGSALPQGADRP